MVLLIDIWENDVEAILPSGAYVTLYMQNWNKGKQTAFILWLSLSNMYNSENVT